MEAVVLTDLHWAIGFGGDQIIRIKADLKRFRELTADGILIYGRKTLETFPGGKPLPGRENWLLTRKRNYPAEGARIFHSLEELLEAARKEEACGKKFYVIGGAMVYESLLPYCDVCHVTEVHRSWPEADCFFPALDKMPEWQEVWRSAKQQAGRGKTFDFYYVRYERKPL